MAKRFKIPQSKNGWAHASQEELIPVVAEMLGRTFCLNPGVVSPWLSKHYGTDYRRLLGQLDLRNPVNDALGMCAAVLDDKPFEKEVSHGN